MVVVLIAAAGAAWESVALSALNAPRDITVLKRCVDIDDLLATAATGQADVAVVALDAPGFDLAAVDRLRASGVRPIAVAGGNALESAAARAARIGLTSIVAVDELAALVSRVRQEQSDPVAPEGGADDLAHLERAGGTCEREGLPGTRGRVIAVWGPAGAPGRTTVAAGLAAVVAERAATVLIDADPYGGSVAQALGILDEVSGLLTASRLAASNALEAGFSSVARTLPGGLSVVTGIPRADRWVEVRDGTVEALIDSAVQHRHVLIDVGFNLEPDPFDRGNRPGRNDLTLAALAAADEVVVVATPDPVGLARLARGLSELREVLGPLPIRVVVNRMRSTLGWSEHEIATMITGFAPPLGLHFLPDDRLAVDAALVSGRTLCEDNPDSGLVRALRRVAGECVPGAQGPPSAVRRAVRRPTRTGFSQRRAAAVRRL